MMVPKVPALRAVPGLVTPVPAPLMAPPGLAKLVWFKQLKHSARASSCKASCNGMNLLRAVSTLV